MLHPPQLQRPYVVLLLLCTATIVVVNVSYFPHCSSGVAIHLPAPMHHISLDKATMQPRMQTPKQQTPRNRAAWLEEVSSHRSTKVLTTKQPICLFAQNHTHFYTKRQPRTTLPGEIWTGKLDKIPIVVVNDARELPPPSPPTIDVTGIVVVISFRSPEHVFHAIMESAYSMWVSLVHNYRVAPPNTALTPILVQPLAKDGSSQPLSPSVLRIMEIAALSVERVTGLKTQFTISSSSYGDVCFRSQFLVKPPRQGLEGLVRMENFTLARQLNAQMFRVSQLEAVGIPCPWSEDMLASLMNNDTEPATQPIRVPFRRNVRVTILARRAGEPRSLLNQKELVGNISQIPNVEVDVFVPEPSELSWGEQMRIAAGTDILISTHGAQLIHMWWLPPHAHVLELLPFGFNFLRFANLALLLRLSHTSVMNPEFLPSEPLGPLTRCEDETQNPASAAQNVLSDINQATDFFAKHYSRCRTARLVFRAQFIDARLIMHQVVGNVEMHVKRILARAR